MAYKDNMEMFNGPLRVCNVNPRYFTDERGKPIYMTGSHTWSNFQDIKLSGADKFDFDDYLDFMQSHNHNFMRLWQWGQEGGAPWTRDTLSFDPLPYLRTGPGIALDGNPKFNLDLWNEEYFDRLRTRVISAGQRGIYVSVMFYEGWCIKHRRDESDPWMGHPFNISNNINGLNGDADGDGKADIFSLELPEVVARQEAFVKKVIDTLNDLDNVLFEIINESANEERALEWQKYFIDFAHNYEAAKPKQHPVGITSLGGLDEHNQMMLDSRADWMAPGNTPEYEYIKSPPASSGQKVIIADSDHIFGHGGNYKWVWKCFLRGLNPIFMDPWQPIPGAPITSEQWEGKKTNTLDKNTRDYPDWEPARLSMGYTLDYANRINLSHMVPMDNLVSTGYCLANPGLEYLIYFPDRGSTKLDLSEFKGVFEVEWFIPIINKKYKGSSINGGIIHEFSVPFAGDAVLYIKRDDK